MSAFNTARGVEAEGNLILLPYLQEQSDGGLVLTSKGTLARWLQESVGDVLLNREERLFAVELKCERRHTGNLFLEVWSNRNLEDRASHAERGQNPGWMLKLRADLLLYYFIDADLLYSIDLFSLKRWFFGEGSENAGVWGDGSLRTIRQKKHEQLNDTWGVLVPLERLQAELPRKAMKWTSVRQRTFDEATA